MIAAAIINNIGCVFGLKWYIVNMHAKMIIGFHLNKLRTDFVVWNAVISNSASK